MTDEEHKDRLQRIGAAAVAWWAMSKAPIEVWSLDDVQDAWERFRATLMEETRHVRH